MIFSDSQSALQGLEKLKTDHPLLTQVQDMLNKTEVDVKKFVFMWIPVHVGIRGNVAADRAAKEALDKEPTDNLMPFADLRPLTAKYLHQVWQKEWDEAVIVPTKLHEILRKLLDKLLPFCKTMKEDTVLNRLQIGRSYLTHSFISKKEELPVCDACHIITTIKLSLIECADLVEVRKKYFEEIFVVTVPKCESRENFDFLKEFGLFYRV